MNKVLITCPSAQFVHDSFLPQGDNQPTHPGDQDGIEGQKKSNTGGKTLAMYSYTMERNSAGMQFFLFSWTGTLRKVVSHLAADLITGNILCKRKKS